MNKSPKPSLQEAKITALTGRITRLEKRLALMEHRLLFAMENLTDAVDSMPGIEPVRLRKSKGDQTDD